MHGLAEEQQILRQSLPTAPFNHQARPVELSHVERGESRNKSYYISQLGLRTAPDQRLVRGNEMN